MCYLGLLLRENPNPTCCAHINLSSSMILTSPTKMCTLSFHFKSVSNTTEPGLNAVFVFSSCREERGLHAHVQRRLIPGAEGAASLRARSAVSPVSRLDSCTMESYMYYRKLSIM